jgi:hypothetical protein
MQLQVREIGSIHINLLSGSDVADLSEPPAAIARYREQSKRLSEDRCQFQRLNSVLQPGLTETEFRNLFTKCRYCEGIKLREVNDFHLCPAPVTDLDSEEDTD